jgi:glycosyltransferase involved in cell wall biosynthesis
MTASRRYCLITPCRDEAKFARRTIESVLRQSERPALWVIVDDGSKDDTAAIVAEYAAAHNFIRLIKRADRGDRALGGGVIDAFYSGYDTIAPEEFDYICKFDLDLDLPPRYFELIMQRMETDPRLGTFSGKPYFRKDSTSHQNQRGPLQLPISADDGFISEKCGDENSVGMIKFYRTECFGQIGGFVRYLMWDGIDCHRCRMLGWIAASADEPALRFEHLRPMGTSHKNWWTGRTRHGVGQYYMGTGPLYMLVSAAFRMTRPPLVVGGAAMLWGYVKSMLTHQARYPDAEFRGFLRRYQRACLLKGKARATASLNAAQASRWGISRSASASAPELSSVMTAPAPSPAMTGQP